MGVLSAPQRVETLSGGAVGGTITGLAAAPLGSWIWAQVGGSGPAGACWPGWGVVLGGGAPRAKSRRTRDRCGGPGPVKPLHPTPRSSRRT